MRKRFIACSLALVMTFSMLVGCDKNSNSAENSTENSTEFFWDNYIETVEAYVSDIYYYGIPEVQDENGIVYEVFVDVEDETGKAVDCFGGFFLVEKPIEYIITYSIDNGKNIYSKSTTLIGIEKAKYELAGSDLVFGLNEVINLDGKVCSATTGEMEYSVEKDGKSIALTDNSFTATETGVYTVEAKLPKQPVYSFELYVVDRTEFPYAEGMILDGRDKQDITVDTAFEDFNAEVSFDETKKYDSQSNGSYKIEAKTTGVVQVDEGTKKGVADTRTLGFSLAPAYGSNYYKALEQDGYKYIAIRYMIENSDYDGTTRLDYISSTGMDEMAIYYDGEKVVDKSEANDNASYTYWNYQLDAAPKGAWAEMLLDISKFTMHYDDEGISLFQMVVNKDCYWDMTMYIDNIYAVKGEAISQEDIKIVEKGETVDLSDLSADTGLDNAICTATFEDEILNLQENTLKVEEYGLYSVAMTDRTMYGSVKQDIIAKGTIVSYSPQNFSVLHGNGNGSVKNFGVFKSDDGKSMNISSNGAGKVNENWQRTTYTVKPLGDVEYFEQLKLDGYKYITYEYTLDYGDYTMLTNTSMYRAALTLNKIPHYNESGLNADTAATHKWLCVDDNSSGDTSTKTSNIYFQSTSYPDTLWNKKTFIISVSIDDFINFYDSKGVNLLTLYFNLAQPEMDYSVTFGRIFPTKEACAFENAL